MKILALETDITGVEDDAFTEELLAEEASRVWELYRAGVFRELYFRADRSAAVLILEARDAGEAAAILATLPLVRKKLIAFEIIPLAAYPGFARLFRKG
jgi:muconolactone delta-isomerase